MEVFPLVEEVYAMAKEDGLSSNGHVLGAMVQALAKSQQVRLPIPL